MLQSIKNYFAEQWMDAEFSSISKKVGIGIVLYFFICVMVGIYWSFMPDMFDVDERTEQFAQKHELQVVTGTATTVSLISLVETLLQKPGGYITNDIFPPGVWLDNISNWEFGVVVQVRDFSSAMRKDFSRSQSQSMEDKDLSLAQPQFNYDNNKWILPSSESQYEDGLKHLYKYVRRLSDTTATDAQFYTRADNLSNWLADVQTRLGSLSQKLTASVGQQRLNTDLAGEPDAQSATPELQDEYIKTSWFKIDDNFYEARGYAWATLHILKAIETDFEAVLKKKNALMSLKQIIRELEGTQDALWSPMVLNGSGYGLLANHSLVMASYITRANAGIIELRELLNRG